MRLFILLLVNALLLCASGAQSATDSLLSSINKAPDDSLKVVLLLELSKALETDYPDSALFYSQQAGALAIKSQSWVLALRASRYSADFLTETGQLNEAEAVLKNSILRMRIGNVEGSSNRMAYFREIALQWAQLGLVFYEQSKLAAAIGCYNTAVRLRQVIDYTEGVSLLYGNVANVYSELSNYPKALEYYFLALKKNEESGNQNGMMVNLLNIGGLYHEQQDYSKAKQYYETALQISRRSQNRKAEAVCLGNLGILFSDQKMYKPALEFYLRALRLDREGNNRIGIASKLINIGGVYYAQHDSDFVSSGLDPSARLKLSLQHYTEALAICEETGDQEGLLIALANIGAIKIDEAQYSQAEDYLRRSLKISAENGEIYNRHQIYQSLYELYSKQKRYREALDMFKAYAELKDSLNREENKEALIEKEMQFEFEKKISADSIRNSKQMELKNSEVRTSKAELKTKQIQQYALLGGLLLTGVFSTVILSRLKLTREQKRIIQEQKELVDHKNAEVVRSIEYAKRIQQAILPSMDLWRAALPDSFILYLPKDIVSGDFFWMEKIGEVVFVAACDCTGHGVPGAMVSVICNSALTRSVIEFGEREPGAILNRTRDLVLENFSKSNEEVKDGMDISLAAFDPVSRKIWWSGANNPLWIYRSEEDEMEEVKADKQPIGKGYGDNPFTTHVFNLDVNDCLYLFTDGFADQFGGPDGKKLTRKKFREKIRSIARMPSGDQHRSLVQFYEQYKGDHEQIDDVCVIGIRMS